MKYAIQIHSGPSRPHAAHTAYRFILAALAAGHEVTRVFFHQDGVYHAMIFPNRNSGTDWPTLARSHGIDLVLCISAAARRGLCDEEGNGATPSPGFRLGGLGLWMEACSQSDRLLVFGD